MKISIFAYFSYSLLVSGLFFFASCSSCGPKPNKPIDSTSSESSNSESLSSDDISNETIYYTVNFYNGDNTILSTQKVKEGENAISPTVTPTKESSVDKIYTFISWSSSFTNVTKDIDVYPVFNEDTRKYLVSFYDEDQTTLLYSNYLEYGSEVTYPFDNPTKEKDNTYTYSFTSWDKDFESVSKDISYYARYDKTYINYSVVFKDYDGSELSRKDDYHYGDSVIIPSIPTRESDHENTYTFVSWDSEVSSTIEGSATYTAIYSSTKIDYTVEFINDGKSYSKKTYHYGDTIEVPSIPSKEEDNTYTYQFSKWDKDVSSTCLGNETYIAIYTPTYKEYEVKFYNDDLSLIEQDNYTYHYGDTIEVPSSPSKDSTKEYTYTFDGWNVTPCLGNKEYIATYTANKRKYLVSFYDDDQTSLLYQEEIEYGVTPIYKGKTPSKEEDNKYTYTFSSWSKELTPIEGEYSVYAIYDQELRNYTITFRNYDDSVYSTITNAHYQESFVSPINPSYYAPLVGEYNFVSWGEDYSTICTGDKEYKAQYDIEYVNYSISFYNIDDTLISLKEDYHYGDSIVVPNNVTYINEKVGTYTFKSWDGTISRVQGNVIYHAQYDIEYVEYKYVYYNEGQLVTTKTYHYGDTISSVSKPTKKSDNTYRYIFLEWVDVNNEAIFIPETCEGSLTLYASYTPIYREYAVYFMNYDGTQLSQGVYHYQDELVSPEDVSYINDEVGTYTFVSWGSSYTGICKGNATYYASYSIAYNDYTITFLNEDNSILSVVEKCHYGFGVSTPENPIKESDIIYSYPFDKWVGSDDSIFDGICYGDQTYHPTFTQTYIEYHVIFKDYFDNDEYDATYHYGDSIVVPNTIKDKQDETYIYHFVSWKGDIKTTCDGEAIYYPNYSTEYIPYTVEFRNEDDSLISTSIYHYGDKIITPEETPTKEDDIRYAYYFSSWGEEFTGNCTGNAIYHPVFRSTPHPYSVTIVDEDNNVIYDKIPFVYGDKLEIPTPVKASDNYYDYVFTSYKEELPETVVVSATYTALFNSVDRYYIVTFDFDNGEDNFVNRYKYNEDIIIPSNPIKEDDQIGSYTFTSYTPEVSNKCLGEVTYKANYDITYNYYTVTFLNYDNEVLKTNTYKYGETINAPTTAYKQYNNTYHYDFNGWDHELNKKCIGDDTYIAQFTEVYTEYIITFYNDYIDRFTGVNAIISSQTYHYGDEIEVPTDVTKPSSETITYTFVSWDKNVSLVCLGSASYTATFSESERVYTVIFDFNNGDDPLVKHYSYQDEIEIPNNPTKASDLANDYRFNKWDYVVSKTCVKDITYTATYDEIPIEYIYDFYNYDGRLLKTYKFNYNDPIVIDITPEREDTAQYDYEFKNWDKTVPSVCDGKNYSFTAVFSETIRKYSVKFVVEDEIKYEVVVDYGTDVTYPYETPTKPSTAEYNYTFSNWSLGTSYVEEDIVTIAQFIDGKNSYVVSFVNDDGTELASSVLVYGDIPTYNGSTPTKAQDNTYTYTFKSWDKDITSVTGNTIYTATYENTYIDYVVTIYYSDDNVVTKSNYHYGDKLDYIASPTIPDNTYDYIFLGWDKEVSEVIIGNATYRASWKKQYHEYEVTFVDEDGVTSILDTIKYHYGDTITIPSTPKKDKDAQYIYTFNSWDKEIQNICYEDNTYVAIFDKEVRKYYVYFNANGGTFSDGTEIYYQYVEYGTEAVPLPVSKDYCDFVKWSNNNYLFVEKSTSVFVVWLSNDTGVYYNEARYDSDFVIKENNDINNFNLGLLTSNCGQLRYYTDENYQNEITSDNYVINLNIGDNIIYVLSTSESKIEQRYVINIRRKPYYSIQFLCDGNIYQELSIQEDDYIPTILNPKKDGYNFVSWDKDVTQQVEDNLVFNAIWEKTEYKITYYLDNGINSNLNPDGYNSLHDEIVLDNPTKDGYSFIGWYTDSTYKTKIEVIYSEYKTNLDLYALWKANSYTVSFVSNGGDSVEDKVIVFDSPLSLDSIERDGFTFGGWFKDINLKYPVNEVFDVPENTVFYAWWKEETKACEFTYTFASNKVTLNSFIGDSTDIRIPDYIGGVQVKTISSSAFTNATNIVSAKFNSYITAVSSSCFSGCSSLIKVELTEHILTVGSSVFYNCISLKQVDLGNNITTIGSSVFSGCKSLEKIVIPNSISVLSQSLFKNCICLVDVTLPSSLLTISNSVFYNCSSLKEIFIPLSTTQVYDYAFYNCTSLENIDIPNSVNYLGASIFMGCKKLTTVKIGTGVSELQIYTFNGCVELLTVEFTDTIKIIGEKTFYNCEKLESISLKDVNHIDNYAFYNCNKLKSIDLSSVTYLGDYVFNNCSLLTSITLPNSFENLGSGIFNYCTSLEEIVIPNGITYLSQYMFYNCTNLKNIILPSTLNKIDDYAFYKISNDSRIQYNGTQSDWDNIEKGANWCLSYELLLEEA